MVSEVIYHQDVNTNSTCYTEIKEFLNELRERFEEYNIVGCTTVLEGEIIHLLQGSKESFDALSDFLENALNAELTIVEWDFIQARDFTSWRFYSDHSDSDQHELRLNRESFFREVVMDKKRIYTPYHYAMKALLRNARVEV
ncbi:MAG: hypothetical protein N4A41_02860 [Crocinitomicaceae bacterium]|jgi:hypothetical protein|nr:hypothetical protein [Crocinitomicaceae bacterium]